jgi:hypothetical protein
MMTLDDFVMLGKTVPEPNSDGRVFVCSAGYSPQLRTLIRIYPLARYAAPPRWSVSTVHLERNPKDHRHESWKLHGDRSVGAHDDINRQAFEVGTKRPESRRANDLARFVISSIKEANRRRVSLAILHPSTVLLEFDHNPESPDSPEQALFDLTPRPRAGARRFPYIPRLWFRDGEGENRLMLRDWGVYELMRKNNNLTDMSEGERRRFVGEALHLDPSCSLLVGNLNNQRTAWLVISVLRGVRDPQPSLLDQLEAVS